MTANRLCHRFDSDEAEIHVVDRDDEHVYQPGLLFVPFGLAQVGEIVRPRRRQLRNGVVFHENEVEEVWIERDVTFYDPEGAEALRGALERFDGGRLVVNLVDMPIKCPVAPLEFAFLTDWYLRELGFDLLVTIPLHGGATYIERSPGLGDALGFVPTNKSTLQTPAKPNVFAL